MERRDITRGAFNGCALTLWRASAYAGAWGDGDADHDEWHRVYTDEQAARARHREDAARARE